MLVDFNTLSKTSRVWIYQSNRIIINEEVQIVNKLLESFISNWNNHGEGLKASYEVKYQQFIILAVDENHKSASGCSIDSSVQIMKKIEKELDIVLFDRMQTAFKDGDTINLVSMLDFKKYVKEDKINSDTIVFNNMVTTIDDYQNKWEVSVANSWHARFLN